MTPFSLNALLVFFFFLFLRLCVFAFGWLRFRHKAS